MRHCWGAAIRRLADPAAPPRSDLDAVLGGGGPALGPWMRRRGITIAMVKSHGSSRTARGCV